MRSGSAKHEAAQRFACCLLPISLGNAAVCEHVWVHSIAGDRLKAGPKLSFERFRRFAASVSFAPRALRPAQQLCATSGKRFLSLKGSVAIGFARRWIGKAVLDYKYFK